MISESVRSMLATAPMRIWLLVFLAALALCTLLVWPGGGAEAIGG